jgi:hemerythrin superfamily protein
MIIATIPMMRLKLITGSHAGKGTCPKPLQREASGLEKERQLGAMLTFDPMDAIQLLTRDHRSVERLFKAYERAGERALKEKQRLAGQVIRDLSIHASVEEQFLYPTARELSEKLDDQVLEALEEHHLAKATLAEVAKMSPSDERFDAKMTVLMESVRHHVEEEEEKLFPKIQRLMDSEDLALLGEAMEAAKKVAPTHPHPMAPDTPPGNIVSDALAKILDSGKDIVRNTLHSARKVAAARLKQTSTSR